MLWGRLQDFQDQTDSFFRCFRDYDPMAQYNQSSMQNFLMSPLMQQVSSCAPQDQSFLFVTLLFASLRPNGWIHSSWYPQETKKNFRYRTRRRQLHLDHTLYIQLTISQPRHHLSSPTSRTILSHAHIYTYIALQPSRVFSRLVPCFRLLLACFISSLHLSNLSHYLCIIRTLSRGRRSQSHLSLSSLAFLFSSLFLSQPSFTHSVLGWMRFTVT